MTDQEQLDKLKLNILHLMYSMDDAPFHGFNSDHMAGYRFAQKKILEGTGIDFNSLNKEAKEKSWF